jgi:uracil-DNA glycosylase
MVNAMFEIIKKYKTTNSVKDFIGKNYNHKIAIIGQDPSITTKNNKLVNTVLMLDDKNSRLYQYISKAILGPLNLSIDEIVAFNLIPIQLSSSILKISQQHKIDFCSFVYQLAEYYYPTFLKKLSKYQAKYIISLGKPVFEFLKRKDNLKIGAIKEVFARPYPIYIDKKKFILIPCVHYNSRFLKPYDTQKEKLQQIVI